METQAIQLNPSVMSLEEVKGVLYLTVRGKVHEPIEPPDQNSLSAASDTTAHSDHIVDTTA